MAVISITHEMSRHSGDVVIYVEADKGTHHSTIASAALHYVRELSKPLIQGVGGQASKIGEWTIPTYLGVWSKSGKDSPDLTRKFFVSFPKG